MFLKNILLILFHKSEKKTIDENLDIIILNIVYVYDNRI